MGGLIISLLAAVLLAVRTLAAPVPAQQPTATPATTPVRLAVLAEDVSPESRALADLLTVELAAIRHVETVERAEIERVLDEQHLTAAAFVDADSRIRLGKVLGAHGLIFIRQDAANSRLLARLVESRKGYIAGFIKQSTVRLSAQLSVRVILKPILDALPKLSIDVAHLQRVTLLQFKDATLDIQSGFSRPKTPSDNDPRRYKWNENDFTILLMERLCRETDIVLMERRQMGELLEESKLMGDSANFIPSTLFIEGELAMVPGQMTSAGPTNMIFTVRFLDPALREVHRIEQKGTSGAQEALLLSAVKAVGQAAQEQKYLSANKQIEAEGAVMLMLAQRYGSMWATDAAYAMQPTNAKVRDQLVYKLFESARTRVSVPVTREKLLQAVALPLARATQICLDNKLPLLTFRTVLTAPRGESLRANLNHSISRSDPELIMLLRPFRTMLRREMEAFPLEPRRKTAGLAAWCPIYLSHDEAIRVYRENLFERLIADATISDADKDFIKGLLLFQYTWPTPFIERLRASNDPVMRFYGAIAQMRAQLCEASRRAAAELALVDLDAVLSRHDAIGSYLYLDGIDDFGRDWMHLALQEMIRNCPDLRATIADCVVHALDDLLRQNHWQAIHMLRPEAYLPYVDPAAAVRWIDTVKAGKPSPKASGLSEYSLNTQLKELDILRATLVEENHDHLQVHHSAMRSCLLANNGRDQTWPIPIADLVRHFKTTEIVYPQQLLVEGDVLWIAWGGLVDESGSDPLHPCGLMQVDLRSGRLLSWRAGLLPGDSKITYLGKGSSGVNKQFCPREILHLVRWGEKIVVAQTGVGVMVYPADAAGRQDLRDVQLINQQKGLINHAIRHVMPLNDKLFIANEINNSLREVLMMWNSADQSVHMVLDGDAALSDWLLPDYVPIPSFVALKTDASRNCLDIVRYLRGGDYQYGVWSYFPTSEKLVFDRGVRRKDKASLIAPPPTPKVWPSGLETTFGFRDWQEGTLAITGPGPQWRLEHFLQPTPDERASAGKPTDYAAAMKAAARRGAVDRLRNMIARGVDINTANEHGSTALMHAIDANQPEAALWLIRQGADISQKPNNGMAALLVAANHDQLQLTVVDELLKRGANPNDANQAGTTVLMMAATKGHMEVVQRLLDHGADPTVRNRNGDNAADHAAWSPDNRVMLHFIDDIVAAGRVNQALLRAVCENRTNNAALLLARGADISKGDGPRTTLLHRAVEYSLPTTVQFLIDRGAKLDSQNSFGRTPLLEAAVHDRLDNVRVLLRAGADPLIKGNDGRNLYDVLDLHDNWDVMASLKPEQD